MPLYRHINSLSLLGMLTVGQAGGLTFTGVTLLDNHTLRVGAFQGEAQLQQQYPLCQSLDGLMWCRLRCCVLQHAHPLLSVW